MTTTPSSVPMTVPAMAPELRPAGTGMVLQVSVAYGTMEMRCDALRRVWICGTVCSVAIVLPSDVDLYSCGTPAPAPEVSTTADFRLCGFISAPVSSL